jgi:outer membrane biosynthesis protein TonB
LQPQVNKGIRSAPEEKGKGLAGAVIIHLALLAMLVLISFSASPPPEKQDGILVNFGTDEGGTGLIEPSASPSQPESSPAQPVASSELPADEGIKTQEFDKEAPEIKKTDPEAEKKKLEAAEAEKKRRLELEAERVRKAQEEAERKKAEEEKRRIDEITNRTRNAMANSRNTGTSSTSEGITGGQGNQGVTTGSVDSKIRGTGSGTGTEGVSFDLAGRSFKSLPVPLYNSQEEGKVVVEIIVDRNGNVTQATPGARGSTTLNEVLLSKSKEAALLAKFDPKPDAPVSQRGTITYIFILK